MRKINLLAALLVALVSGRIYASSPFNGMGDFTGYNSDNNIMTNNQYINLTLPFNEEEADISLEEYNDNTVVVKMLFSELRDHDLIRNIFSNSNLLRDGPVDIDNLTVDQLGDRIALYESNDNDSGRTRFEFLLIKGGNTGIEMRNFFCLGALAAYLESINKKVIKEEIKEKGFYM